MIPSYLETFPLLEALRSRRSRRFARGLTMPPRGALAYQSHQAPQPLSETEEGLLAFAACGVTGHALADLPLGEGEGGNIMLTLLGRTVASGDAAQTVAMVVINDDGAHLVRRPRELPIELFNEETGCFVLDDRAGFRPAGLSRFARSKGGHLENDPGHERLATVQRVELIILDVVTIEQGMMQQNLALMAEAMGLGGCWSFAEHEYGWFEALGFHMRSMSATRYLGGGRLVTMLSRLLGKDAPASYPLGLERDGQVLLRAMTPPYFSSMAEAVRYVGEQKTGARGFFRGRAGETAWQGGARVAASLPPISDKAVAATTAYCEYLWARYGRLPVNMAPFRTVLRFQAAHLDKEFYERFYRPGALGAAHYGHQARWHEAE